MNDSLLQSLMRLFAIIVGMNKDMVHVLARNYVESFLKEEYRPALAKRYLAIFDQYTAELVGYEKSKQNKKIAVWSVKILVICQEIVEELHIRHRFMILISLIRFSQYFSSSSRSGSNLANALSDAIRTVANGLLISEDEYESCSTFITDKFYNVPDRKNLLIVSDDPEFEDVEIKHIQKDRFPGQLFVLRIERADTYLYQYAGKATLNNNGRNVFPRQVYVLPKASAIRTENLPPVYYSEIVSGYIRINEKEKVEFLARDIEFRFKNSSNGIHRFSFKGRSGELVGVLGGSGAGKSTLLKVLTGSLKPNHGDIFINGYKLKENAAELKGMIGYVPQDDLLIEELTVYQNLHFNARLCLNGYKREEIHEMVLHILNELGLYEVRHLKVGNPLKKFISGGQRKRLNIALELIREPHILFLDEPTSGLSSTDSENVVALLKEQALKGRLVIINIHQPSSELFKQFDQLLVLDTGGYPIYAGNPLDGITYFKQLSNRVDAEEAECQSCGNTNPDDILKVVEERDVDELGEFSQKRKVSPASWYKSYQEKIESQGNFEIKNRFIPENKFQVPGKLKQFLIFFQRNLLSKLADRQFLAIALLVAPMLAVILGFFSKYVAGTEANPHAYIFSQNENLPAYLFMSVVVALFLGMIVSAEEIIKDRRMLERESFLHLNRTAYLFSKISLLFILSGFQMLLFVLIGNWILGIRGLGFLYWLVLFSSACFANMLGLIISDGLKSVVAIYVIVPFLLVPQIMLAGIIVKFDKLHYRFASHQTVPMSGEVMASRWAYEALVVAQFADNDYQKHFFETEKLESNITYDRQFLIPAMLQELEAAEQVLGKEAKEAELEERLRTFRLALDDIFLVANKPDPLNFTPERFTSQFAQEGRSWLLAYKEGLTRERKKTEKAKDCLIDSLLTANGASDAILRLKREYHNESLADLTLNRNELHKIKKIKGRLIRKFEPVYAPPAKQNGRAQFLASTKQLGKMSIPTPYFNVLVIWCMSVFLYVLLHFSALERVLGFFANREKSD